MAPMQLIPGGMFAGYRIVRHLGSGLTGEVYLAEHPSLTTPVALTIMPGRFPTDSDRQARFGQRLGRIGALTHPHIATVRDWGHEPQAVWYVSDWVDGSNVQQLLVDRFSDGIPAKAVLTIAAAIADALDYAHNAGALHLQVEPTTIMITGADTPDFRIVLTDFAIRNIRTSALTGNAYTAPELRSREQPLVRSTDQYALAATVLHMLVGNSPGIASEFDSAGRQALQSALNLASVPAAMRSPLSNATATDPEQRYSTCRQFVADLSASTRAPSAPPVSPPTTGAASIRAGAPAHDAEDDPPSSVAASSPAVAWRRPGVLTAAIAAVAVLVASASAFYLRTEQHEPDNTGKPRSSSVPPAPPPQTVPAAPLSQCAQADAAVSQLSLRDKLAQLLMVGVTGADDARAVVTDQHVGGIFIGSWTDLSMLTDGSLQSIAAASGPLPLAVSVDEEGGRVERLAKLIGHQPSPRILAQTSSPADVYEIALERGRRIHDLGITVDFAPVVDVTDAPNDSVIGDRSFGSDPQRVVEFAQAYARGLRDANVLPVLKHFPGHGHGSGDSHTGQVQTPPLSELMDDDLIPYRSLTTDAPVGVMVGHLEVPELTGTDPASLSPAAYALLRSGEYGGTPFDAIVFTDDLSSMAAIKERYGVAEAVTMALRAGADTALWITTDQVPAVLDRLESAYNAGDLTPQRVDDALRHVVAAKHPRGNCGAR